MPIRPTIRIDWENAEARLDLGDRFKCEDPVFQLDILQAIEKQAHNMRIGIFDREYNDVRLRI